MAFFKHFKVLSVVFIALMTISCAVFIDDSKIAFLNKRYFLSLPSPNLLPLGESQEALLINYDKKSYNLIVMLQNDGQTLNLIALSDLGIKLFAASFDGKEIELRKYINIKSLPRAQQVLLDIFLSHGQLKDIEAKLPQDITIKEDNLKRTIYDKDGVIIYEIDYIKTDSGIYPKTLKHHIFNYTITITKM